MSTRNQPKNQNTIHKEIEDFPSAVKINHDLNRSVEAHVQAKELMMNSVFADAFKMAQEGFWNYSFESGRFDCTGEAFTILELPGDFDCSSFKNIAEYLHPSEKIKIQSLNTQIGKNINSFEFNLRFVLHDGSNKYVAVKAKLKRDLELNPIQLFGIFRDITEEYYNTQQLKENEELFRSLFNNLTDVFIIFELVRDAEDNVIDYVYKDVNPVFEMKFDLPKAEIINKKLSNQVQLFQQFQPFLKITAITHEPQQNSFFIQSLDSFVDVLIYSPSENLIATIWRDVSLMVEANSSLRESEEKYRQIFAIGKDGLFMLDFLSGKIIDVNPSGCEMFEFSKDQLAKMRFKELFTEPDLAEGKIVEQKLAQINAIGIKQNGTEFPIEASLSYFNWSGRKVAVASVRDTTDRANTQKELIKSEKKFKQLFDFSNDAILIIKDYKIVEFNKKSQQIFEVPGNEFSNGTLWGLSPAMQPNGDNSRVKMLELLQQAVQGNQLEFEWVFEKSNKSIFYADIKLSPIFFENEKIIQAIVRDISPRKLSEEALKLKENRWKQSLEISSTGVWEWNIITNEVYFSQVWLKIIGYEKDEFENSFEEYEKRIHPDDVQYVYNNFETYFAAKTSTFSVVFRFRCKNGTYKWINSRGKIYSYTQEGKPERFVGTHTDVTRFKLAEEKHHVIEEKYRQASIMTKMGYWELNLKNMILTAPEQTFNIFGIQNTLQVTLKQIETLIHPEDQQQFISQFITSNQTSKRDCTFRILVDNQTRFVASITTPLTDNKNTLIGFEGIFQDITSFKKDEQQLKDDQKLIKSYLAKTNQAIISIQDDQIVFMNNRFSDLSGFKAEELNSEHFKIIDQVMPEDKPFVQQYFDQISENSRLGKKIKFRLETKSKRVRWIEMYSSTSEFKGREATMFIFEDITERVNSEQKYSTDLQQKSSLIKYAPIGIALIDLNEILISINSEFENITEIGERNMGKTSLKDLFKTTDYDTIQSFILLFKEGKSFEFFNEFELINNHRVQVKLIPTVTEKLEIQGYVLFLQNIDLIRKQIDLLSDENFIQKSIINELSAGIGLFDSNKQLIQNNQKLFSLFELENEVHPIGFVDFINDSLTHFPLFESTLKTRETNYYLHKTKQQKTISVELVNLTLEHSSAILMQATDVTEQNNKLKLISGQLEKFESIFQNSPLGIALVDKNRNIVICNQKYASILKYDIPELNHKRLDQLIQIENLFELINNFSELFTNVTQRFDQTLQMTDKSGIKHWINSTFTPLFDQFSEVSFAIHVIDDISTNKESEYSIINNERLKTLSYLANSFAHEFNNQLMAMYGNSYLLKSNLTDPILLKYADALFNTITKASELTHSLLSFSKTSHKINVVLNLPKLLNELIDQSEFPPNISVKTQFDQKCEVILGDSALLQRAFLNIIENSIEAMQQGGELAIETKSVYFEEQLSDLPSVSDKGKYIRIRFTDTGLGINVHDISKIFDPFYTTKTSIQNAGLGLTIALKTIQEHGGTIKVKSSSASTELMVYLPQPNDELIRESVQPDEQLIVKGSANLLTIDDEDVVRIVTGELLKKLGYNIFSFASGSRALKFYKENQENIDLVILDKHMPEMDGKEVYKKLKEFNPDVKVVLLTGFNIDDEIQEFFNNENNKIIQKPVSIEKLSKAISSLLISK